jgi:Peptidase_C39 like family
MRHPRSFVCLLLVLIACATLVAPAGAKGSVYSTGFVRWRAADGGFAGWDLSGANITADGTLQLDPATAQSGSDVAGGYYSRNFYNGGSFLVGEALSPVTPTRFGFFQAIASWNASTPPGTWIETKISVQIGDHWTKWYNLGVWAADYSTIKRHSVNLQGDADGFVAVDTLVLTDKKVAGNAFQLKVRLFKDKDSNAIPSVRNMAVTFSTTPVKPSSLTPVKLTLWPQILPVPECSQMVYPDGGEVWCSPTSTSMVLAYWQNDTGPCEPRVRAAVDGVYDWVYDGHGNWPFNTAYAATHNLEGYVARFTSMAQAEEWIAAGVPVVISYAWKKSTLTGAPIPSSGGHLAVLVGFDASGDPVVNDPAAASDGAVQRTYLRAELESLWLEHSGGTVYLIYPSGHAVPGL